MTTEGVNPRSRNIDKASTLEMLRIINTEDHTVAEVVEQCLPEIASAVDVIAEGLKNGGRMIYVGAGTSGRLAVQDAAECTVTYGVPRGTVDAVIAGGRDAVFFPSENAEDKFELGQQDLRAFNLNCNDSVIGISASGNARYVCGALDEARNSGANTVAVLCNASGKIMDYADISVCAPTGAEVICGSTRMKAGTAQKMILNMFSTAVMIKLGRVNGNFMTWMRPTNDKLVKRAAFIIAEVCGITEDEAAELLAESDNNIQNAIAKMKG